MSCGHPDFNTPEFRATQSCCACGGGCYEGEDCPDPRVDTREEWLIDFERCDFSCEEGLKMNMRWECPEGEELHLNIAEARSCITYLCNKYTCTEEDGEDCCDQLDTQGVPWDYDVDNNNHLNIPEF
jgi:hypothetical protein